MDKAKKDAITGGIVFLFILIFILALGISEYRDSRKREIAEKKHMEEIKREAFWMQRKQDAEVKKAIWKEAFMLEIETEVQKRQDSEAEALRGIKGAIEGKN